MLAGSSLALAEPPANAFRFFHDADGRLKAAIDPEGETAVYSWDAGGNLSFISRSASSKLSIIQLSPPRGAVGGTVKIEGSGFSSTPGSNMVKFNGTAATVTEASPLSLSVNVPTEAKSGYVTVSTPGEGPVTSPETFMVGNSSKPTISSISPTIAATEDEVTISGSGFDGSSGGNIVVLNRSRPEVVSASESAIKIKVPESTLGGHVSVSTGNGVAGGPDLYVPPNKVSASKVGTTGRFSIGESTTTTLSKSGTIGLKLFDGTGGQKVAFALSEATFSGNVSIWSPRGVKLSGSEATFTGSGKFIEPVKMPESGTYTVRVDSAGEATGSVKLTSYPIEDLTGSITPSKEGASQSVSITTPGQNAIYSVEAKAGQSFSVKASNADFDQAELYRLEWLDPWGNFIAYEYWFGKKGSGFWNPRKFTSAGTYTLKVNPLGSMTGSVDLTAYLVEDLSGSITPSKEGAKTSVSITTPGQNAIYSVEAKAGQSFSVKASNANFDQTSIYWLEWRDPADNFVAHEYWWGKSGGGFWGSRKFTSAGTYTLKVNPESSMTGSVDLTVWDAPDKTGDTITPSVEGGSGTYSVDVPGQRELITFAGEAGQGVSIVPSGASFSGSFSVFAPSGSEVSGSGGNLSTTHDSFELPATGTYTIRLVGNGEATGSVKLTAYKAKDLTGSITPTKEGAKQSVSITTPGQNAIYSVAVEAGQSLSVNISNANFDQTERYWVEWLNPSGGSIAWEGWYGKNGSGFLERRKFTSAGTYTLKVDPVGSMTGSVDLTAYLIEDLTGSITPTKEGAKQTVSIATPGQDAIYSVEAKAGQSFSVKASNANFDQTERYYVEWLSPSGKEITYESWFGKNGGGFWGRREFTSAGTYTLKVDPVRAMTGSVDLTVWDATDKTGDTITPSTEGESKTVSVDVPGQRTLVTFPGTSGTIATLKVKEAAFSGAMSVWRPNGALISGSENSFSSTSTARAEVNLPETGTYTVRLTGSGEATGSGVLVAYLGSHVAWPFSTSDTMQLVSYRSPGLSDFGSERSDPALASATGEVPSRQEDQSSPFIGHLRESEPSQKRQGVAVTAAMRQYHPSAYSAWHPARTRPGARGWEAGKAESPWTDLAPLRAPVGTIALAGQALGINGLPLAGVQVSLEGSSVATRTDQTGRFLLSEVSAGRQKLIVAGETSGGKERYGSYEVGVELVDHQTTDLGYTIWLTPLNESGDQRIASPARRETRLKTPRIPGLEVRIPAGTVIRDAAGHVVRELNLSPIPVDRPPFPLPPFVSVPLYFTVQPGRAYLSKGAQIVYPNWGDLPPGQRVDFWNYDANDRGWYVYGRGTVTADGKQVIPDPGVRVWEFTGAMISSSPAPPPDGPIPGGGSTGGDPVDMYTGLFTHHSTDLMLPDSIPISIERTYRQRDSNSYSFGTGTTSLYDMRLWSSSNYKEADLILPDGGRVHYVRISEGTGYGDAVYRSTSSPSRFFGSVITWDGSIPGWNLKLTNGYTYVFGEFAGLQAIRDPFGNTLTLTRPSGQNGNITKVTSPHGRWAKLSYDPSSRITEVTDNGGRHLKYTYTSGLLTKVEGLAGRTTNYEYDGSGRMKAIVDPRGNKFLQNVYDANGRVEKQTIAGGGTFQFSYKLTEAGKPESTTLTEPLGDQRKVEFNPEGFPTSETGALGTELAQTTSFERQPATGLVLSTNDPLGRETVFEYDSNGNVKEMTRLAETSEAETSKFAYQPGTSHLIEATDPLGHTTKYQYGPNGELLERTDPLGHETSFEYNRDGQPTAITNAEGETSKLSYEGGDLVTTTNPLGNTTRRFVDGLGRLRSITLPGGERYLYDYNEADELTSSKTPSGAEVTIEYDADGNPTAITDPRGGETTMSYDAMDRIIAEADPLEHTAEFDYDQAGNLVEAIDRRGEVSTFDYDGLNRLSRVSYGISGETSESTIDYEYDEGDRLVGIDDSAAGEYTLSYDNLDQLTGTEGPNGSVGYGYDSAGRRTSMEVPGRTVGYEYDSADRLTKLTSGTQVVSLAYDKADRLQALTLPDGLEQLYGYDKAGEATSIAYKNGETTLGEINYAYDANGQTEAMWGSYARLGLPEGLKSTKYNAANELVEREGKALTYDDAGNLTADGTNEYAWNARGQLTKISGSTSASFGYDPFGLRVSKTLGGTTTKLLYDGPNVVQEAVGGSVTANILTGLGPDQIFSRTTSAGTSSYLVDRLGSTIALANSSGEVKTTYTYDPFGKVTEAGEASDNPFQFTGRENDGTGLQYNRARYYRPEAGFISRDPSGMGGSGTNLYAYVSGDPVDFTDPTGLEKFGGGGGFAGGGGGSDWGDEASPGGGFPPVGGFPGGGVPPLGPPPLTNPPTHDPEPEPPEELKNQMKEFMEQLLEKFGPEGSADWFKAVTTGWEAYKILREAWPGLDAWLGTSLPQWIQGWAPDLPLMPPDFLLPP
jgi:RHS repeat-associated protein